MLSNWLRTSLVLLLFAAPLPKTSALAEDSIQVDWQPLGDGLSKGKLEYSTTPFFSSYITLVKADLSRYRLGVIRAAEYGSRRQNVRTLCRQSRSLACINASFFDEEGKPLGLLISRGVIHQKLHRGGGTLTGVLTISRQSINIIHRDAFSPTGVWDAVQAGPRLLSKGNDIEGLRESLLGTNLSGICLDKSGEVILYQVSNKFLGLSLSSLQDILRSPQIQCVDALNFDGGGSSQLYISDKIPGASSSLTETYITGEDVVPVVVGLFVK